MDAFEAIADPVRRDLLARLGSGPARVVDLAAAHPISRPAVSRHLRVLTDAGLVAGSTQGRERHYRLEPAGLGRVRAWLDALAVPADAAPPVAAAALDALDLEVRRTSRERRNPPPGRPSRDEEETG